MNRLKFNSKGFSLVELICAIAILGATITVLLNSFVIGTNVSKRIVKKSEATLAGKNVLEAVAASSIDDFYSQDATGKVKELLGSDLSVSLLKDKDEEDNFTVALENLHAGGSDFDAEVEFSRGDKLERWTDEDGKEVESRSHGLYLINSEQIKLAQYDAMDGVFCQPYEVGSNPDLLVEDEIKAEAYSKGLDPVNDLSKRERRISVYVTHDPSNDWTLNSSVPKPEDDHFDDFEHVGRYHYCTIVYDYIYTYSKSFVVNNLPKNQITWSRSYTVFPGGYEPQNKDGSISVYLMYYPVYSDKYESDDIYIYNNSMAYDASQNKWDPIEYELDDGSLYTVNLNTYLYCQDSYEYKDSYLYCPQSYHYTSDGYEYTTNSAPINENIRLTMPMGYNLSELKGTYIYTNAKEICLNSSGSFDYFIRAGAIVGWGQNSAKYLDNDLVRKEDKIKIYNIKVTLYKVDNDNPNFIDNDGKKAVREGAKPAYTIYGTRTN